ncbi:MAG: hypothetical protein F4204_16145 [Rhodospirillaceae bacterium]|nr:hypothetical protein [Rhodospirillaceae bacterium]
MIDYANAHPIAKSFLVNYGPVGDQFNDLPDGVANRCEMIGWMNPDNPDARNGFRQIVREIVGRPKSAKLKQLSLSDAKTIVIDISASMRCVLRSEPFWNLLRDNVGELSKIYLVDTNVRAEVSLGELENWLTSNELGTSTNLLATVSNLVEYNEDVFVITDVEGRENLAFATNLVVDHFEEEGVNAIILRISKENFERDVDFFLASK